MSSYTELLETLQLTEEEALKLLLDDLRAEMRATESTLRAQRLQLLKSKILQEIVTDLSVEERGGAGSTAHVEMLREDRSRELTRIRQVEQRLEKVRGAQ